MFARQSSLGGTSPLHAPPAIGPSPEEIDAERERILFRKHVRIARHNVRVFNMHDARDVAAYEVLLKSLIEGTQARTHVIWDNDRQLVTNQGNQSWQRYLEWSEFVLDETATAPVGAASA